MAIFKEIFAILRSRRVMILDHNQGDVIQEGKLKLQKDYCETTKSINTFLQTNLNKTE